MKEFLENSRQFVHTVAARVGRAINPPLTGDAAPLDLQHAILEAIEARTQPVGGGRREMPDNYVKVRVVAKDAATERAMQLVLSNVRALASARLRELQCEVAPAFRIDVAYVRRRPAGWHADQPMAIEFEADAPSGAGRPAPVTPSPGHAQPELVLTILKGRASEATYALREPAVRIGRSSAPVDDRGRARHNHVAFSDGEDAHSRTVGRGHCEIRYDHATREYRIFDERSANGTRIVRQGEVIDVPPSDPFGIAIRTGDELQFGTAAVGVEIGD
ncbi:MAG: FHA domain-containing protein [Acidobacteriota bacterium]|nr:FHA domain-containing protein [Acidobacteriota bacterium]